MSDEQPAIGEPASDEQPAIGEPALGEPAVREPVRREPVSTGSNWTRWIAPSARTVVGTLVAVAAVVAIATGVSAPWPTVAHEPPSVIAVPQPSDTIAVCPGPVLALGRTVEEARRISVAAPVRTTASAPLGVEERFLDAPEIADDNGIPAYVAVPESSAPAPLAVATSAMLTDDDIRGFAAAACRPALLESWVVGGLNTTGTTGILLLANPGEVTASVTLTVYGAQGPQTPPGGAGINVPAGTQLALPLSGIAGGDERPIVQITATGAPVAAALQASTVRTITPIGLDVQGAVAAPDRVQVLPGFAVPPGTPAEGELVSLVRLLAPASAAEVTVTVQTATAADRTVVSLEAGLPVDLDLGTLLPGDYTVTVQASEPVVAAAWHSTGIGEGADFAWTTPAPVLTAPTEVAVAEGPDARLTLVNTGTERAEVTLTSTSTQTVSVPVEGSIVVPVAGGTSWTIDPGTADGVRAAVSYNNPGAVAAYPVWPADVASGAVTVYP